MLAQAESAQADRQSAEQLPPGPQVLHSHESENLLPAEVERARAEAAAPYHHHALTATEVLRTEIVTEVQTAIEAAEAQTATEAPVAPAATEVQATRHHLVLQVSEAVARVAEEAAATAAEDNAHSKT